MSQPKLELLSSSASLAELHCTVAQYQQTHQAKGI